MKPYSAICLHCSEEVPVDWDDIGNKITCQHCGKKSTLEYDESYDEELNEEYQYWILS
ncbi:MAG TPA: hypothetical protein VJ201_07215 [Candidatus Babeliales bacterium]|nr:hypothetical protein [Candidatus Babeliales bacterium]